MDCCSSELSKGISGGKSSCGGGEVGVGSGCGVGGFGPVTISLGFGLAVV